MASPSPRLKSGLTQISSFRRCFIWCVTFPQSGTRPVGWHLSRGLTPIPWAATHPVGCHPSRGLPPIPWAATHPVGCHPSRGLRYAPPTAVLFHRDAVPCGMLWYRGLRCAPPTAVLFHRDAVPCGMLWYRGFRIPWVITHGCVISLLRSSKRMICNNYELCIMNYALKKPTAVLYHRDAVLFCRQLRSLWSLTSGYEWSRPAGERSGHQISSIASCAPYGR